MLEEQIAEVGIDVSGSLYVRPQRRSFPHIHRAAMQVEWDDATGRLFSPVPKEWSHLRWFEQIAAAAADEYGVRLTTGPATIWSNVSQELRESIQAVQPRPSGDL